MQLDFAKLNAYPIAELCAKLGLKLAEKQNERFGLQLVGGCAITPGTNTTCFKVTPSINRFICHCSACKQLPKPGGDNLELVKRIRGITDARQAAAELSKLIGAGEADANARPQQEVATDRKATDFDPLKYLETLDAGHEALSDLDILPETLIAFKAGYSSKGLLRGRLAVPWHDQAHNIICYFGVALDGVLPRYKFPQGAPSPYWFNAHTLEESEDEPVRILSDVLDVMRAVENGAVNVICPIAPVNELSLAALSVIIKPKKLTVAF